MYRHSANQRRSEDTKEEQWIPHMLTGVAPSFWFVGAFWGEDGDQTSRFLEEEIWENGDDGEFLDKVRSMRPGDRIAIKAAYRRKHGLTLR